MTGLQLRVGDLAISFIVPLLGLPTSPFHHLQRWRTNLHFMFAPRKLDFDAHDDAMDASGELIPSQLTYVLFVRRFRHGWHSLSHVEFKDDDDEEDDFFHVNAPLMPLVSASISNFWKKSYLKCRYSALFSPSNSPLPSYTVSSWVTQKFPSRLSSSSYSHSEQTEEIKVSSETKSYPINSETVISGWGNLLNQLLISSRKLSDGWNKREFSARSKAND